MRKCFNFNFPTWIEEKNTTISLDEKYIEVDCMSMFFSNLNEAFSNNKCTTSACIQYTGNIQYDYFNSMAVSKIIIEKSTPSDPVLAKLCEITGAKMYGDYVVFLERDSSFSIELFRQYYLYLIGKKNNWEELKKLIGI